MSYRGAVMSLGPVGYWRLGEKEGPGAIDETGNHPGTYNGGVALGGPGALGERQQTAPEFDGVDDFVSVPNHADLNFGVGDFSVGCWFRDTGGLGATRCLMSKRADPTALNGWILRFLTDDKLNVWMSVDNTAGGTTSTSTPSAGALRDGKWHHLVFVRQVNGDLRFYVDGDLFYEFLGSTVRDVSNTGELKIGQFTSSSWWMGGLDEAFVVKRVLTAREVSDLYQTGLFDPAGYWYNIRQGR